MTQQLVESIHVKTDGSIATVTIGTGRRRNALDTTAWRQLENEFTALSDKSALRAVLVRGATDTFCAGSDMTDWVDTAPEKVEESFARMEAAFQTIEACPVPVIAEISGVAAGAGCQLAMACDLRIMADSAHLGMPIARLGILASPAFAARLVRLAGPELAGELLYTGRLLDAGEAVTAGLASATIPQAELSTHTEQLLARITEQPPAAVRAAKHAIATAVGPLPGHSLDPAVAYPDFQRAIAAFLTRDHS